jgi:hypothetical protein
MRVSITQVFQSAVILANAVVSFWIIQDPNTQTQTHLLLLALAG